MPVRLLAVVSLAVIPVILCAPAIDAPGKPGKAEHKPSAHKPKGSNPLKPGNLAAAKPGNLAAKLSPPPPPPVPEGPVAASDDGAGGGGLSGAGLVALCVVLLGAAAAYSYSKDLLAATENLSSWGQQIGSFLVLVAVQSSALLLFKLCQSSGSYSFAPAASVALTELFKLGLAVTLHLQAVQASGAQFFEGVTPRIVAHYFGLALCYTVNNQLTFYALEVVDPGTFGLGKSLAPYLVALMLRFTGKRLNQLQWVCILLQCICIAITQYNPCKDTAMLTMSAYGLLILATSITAVSSVWNQKVVKGFAVPVNLQNTLLYAFGFSIAMLSYAFVPDSKHTSGFFAGFSLLAWILVLFQAFHGLAVTLVYKYADAIVKNFANSAVMAILVLVSVNFFGAAASVISFLGVAGVLVTTYAYMNIALKIG